MSENYKDKYFKTNLAYLDLVELVKYHAPHAYDKIFLHGNDKSPPCKLIIDRQITNTHAENIVNQLKSARETMTEIAGNENGYGNPDLAVDWLDENPT